MSPRDNEYQKDESRNSGPIYTSINAADSDDNIDIVYHPPRRVDRNPVCILLISAVASLILGFLAGNISQILPTPRIFSCRNPVVRKEWRVLSFDERQEYYRAVKCLAARPSRLGLNGTVYDDFAWIHTLSSAKTHNTSSFMPWHRAVLNLYENILVEECAFTGHMPYWDWTLDWADLAHSSIWDPISGFGGDGEPNGTMQVGWGRCLDRLWWQWQQVDPARRLLDYSGLYDTDSGGQATLEDDLSLGGLAKDVTVGDVMDTQGECQ
ncbi:hypothetical protein B7463_g2357, partial [Scytalidium lignicola]